MWNVQINGAWQNASSDQVRELIQRGVIGPQTVVKHETWLEPGRLGQVQAFSAFFPKTAASGGDGIDGIGDAAVLEYRSAPGHATAPGVAQMRAAPWLPGSLEPLMRPAGLGAGAVAGLLCMVAGMYLLSWTPPAEAEKGVVLAAGPRFPSVLLTGLGIYFCATALGVWAMTLFGFVGTRPRA